MQGTEQGRNNTNGKGHGCKMKMTIAVTTINQIETLKRFLDSIADTVVESTELILLDNGSTDPEIKNHAELIKLVIENSNPAMTFKYIRNDINVGLYKAYNQIAEASSGDWVAIFHNDIILHEYGWDKRVRTIVETLEGFGRKIGIVGFVGGTGLAQDGARVGMASNLRDVAEIHGRRMTDFMPAIVLDGCALIMNKKMLADVGGFDEQYIMHHIYDYDISLASIEAGYVNLVIGIDITHQGGVTACGGDAQTQFNNMGGEQSIMENNIKRWHEKWAGKFPVRITEGWNIER